MEHYGGGKIILAIFDNMNKEKLKVIQDLIKKKSYSRRASRISANNLVFFLGYFDYPVKIFT